MPLYQMSQRAQGFLCFFVGIIGILICLYNFYEKTIFLEKAIKVHGKVISVQFVQGDRYPYKLTVSFASLKSKLELYAFKSKEPHFIGDDFQILYDPQDMQRVSSVDVTHSEYVDMAGVFVICCALIPMGWVRIKYNQKLFGYF